MLSLIKRSQLRHLHGRNLWPRHIARKLCKTLIIRITAVWQCLPTFPENLRSNSLLHTIVRETSRNCKWRRWNIYKFSSLLKVAYHPMLVGKLVENRLWLRPDKLFLAYASLLVLICASYCSVSFLYLFFSWFRELCLFLYTDIPSLYYFVFYLLTCMLQRSPLSCSMTFVLWYW